jgi:RNA polymerase sigma factor (sigma-70 family)
VTEPVEGRPLDEKRSIERAQDGDVGAFEELVALHQDAAFRTAYLIAGRTGDAEDAAQEAFIKAFHALHRFRGEAPFRPWLLAIVANEARNRLRSASRRAGLATRAGEERPSGDAIPSPEAAFFAEAERDELVKAMHLLEEPDRLVIAYRYLFEMSESEMATALGCARGTVKSRLSRSLAKLRALLAEGDHR